MVSSFILWSVDGDTRIQLVEIPFPGTIEMWSISSMNWARPISTDILDLFFFFSRQEPYHFQVQL